MGYKENKEQLVKDWIEGNSKKWPRSLTFRWLQSLCVQYITKDPVDELSGWGSSVGRQKSDTPLVRLASVDLLESCLVW